MESPEEQSRVSQQQRDKILTYSNVAFQTDSSVLSQFKSEKLEENPSSFSPMKPAPPILSKTPICSEISSNAHSYQCSTSKSNSNSGGSNLTSPCAVATDMLTALPTSSDEMADRGDSLHVSELSLPPSPVLQRESPVLLRFLSDTQTTSQLELVTRLENRSGNEIFPRDEGMPSFSNNTPDSEVVLNQVSDSVNNINEITREMRILLLEGFTILEHNNQSDIQAPETFCVNNEKQVSNKNCRKPQMESPEEQSRVSQQQRDKILTYSNVAIQNDSSVLSQFKLEKLKENLSSFSPIKPAPPILSKQPICSERSSNAHSYQCSTSKSNSNSGGSNLTSPCTVATDMLTALPTSSEMVTQSDTKQKRFKTSNVKYLCPQSLWLIAPPNAIQVLNFGLDSFDYLKLPLPIDHKQNFKYQSSYSSALTDRLSCLEKLKVI